MRFLESIADAILGRSPEELIGAMLIAAAVALVMTGLYVLGRRRSIPSPNFVGGLAFAAGALGMALAAGYIDYAEADADSGQSANHPGNMRWAPRGPGRGVQPPPRGFRGMGWSSGFHVVVAADRNRDGHLTPEEVVGLVREADADGDGSVNFRDIDRLIAGRLRPPSPPTGVPAAGTEDRRTGDGPPGRGRGTGPAGDVEPSSHLDE